VRASAADRAKATQTAVANALNAAAERIEKTTQVLNNPHHRRRRGDWLTIPRVKAGGLPSSWLDWCCEAASRVRKPYIPGALSILPGTSLAGSVDPVTWCPPTFVGNSGIEGSNGHRGFALFFLVAELFPWIRPTLPSYPANPRGIQYAAASRPLSSALWNTGSPAFAGDDSEIHRRMSDIP